MTTAAKSDAPRVCAIFVGMPADVTDPDGRTWHTALFKRPVHGDVYLDYLNLVGDGQSDLVHHGGLDKAVCVYPRSHYPIWRERLATELPYGAFGENFSVDGQDEDTVCLGDVYAIGGARVQVSQPRSPCWKIARRWHKSLALWFQETGATGWYMRVVERGEVRGGDAIRLVERPFPQWPVRRLNQIRYHGAGTHAELSALADCTVLTVGWRARMRTLRDGGSMDDDSTRLGEE